MTPTMKAIRLHGYGGPEVLRYEDAPRPVPGPKDVVIKVHAVAINPVDWKIRQGYAKDRLKHPLPLILGWDVSGVIETVGSEVTGYAPGDEVFSRPNIARDGAYAEYIAVDAGEIARKPASIDHVQAAAIPLAGLTAWQSLFDAGGLTAGQRILIHAAAGGVGIYAVQLAKWKGATVIGTASPGNHAFLKELGVDEVIDYNSIRFEDVVRDVDMVLDTIGGETQSRSWSVLKPGGILVSITQPPSKESAAAHGVRGGYVFIQPNAAQLKSLADLVDAGKLKAVVETILPLDQAARAHEMNQAGHTRGKIVLRVRS